VPVFTYPPKNSQVVRLPVAPTTFLKYLRKLKVSMSRNHTLSSCLWSTSKQVFMTAVTLVLLFGTIRKCSVGISRRCGKSIRGRPAAIFSGRMLKHFANHWVQIFRKEPAPELPSYYSAKSGFFIGRILPRIPTKALLPAFESGSNITRLSLEHHGS